MKGLPTLIRLHSWRVDEARRKLADLERLDQDMRATIARFDERLATEQETARTSNLIGHDYAAFAAEMKRRRMTLQESLDDLAARIRTAREEVTDAYRELRKYEVAEANKRQAAHMRNVRREQIMLDEIALGMFRRRESG